MDAVSLGTVAGYLSTEQKQDLLKHLASNLQKEGSVHTLCEIAHFVNDQDRSDILPALQEFCHQNLKNERSYKETLELIQNFGAELCNDIIGSICETLTGYTTSSMVLFDEAFLTLGRYFKVIAHTTDDSIPERKEVISALLFLEELFMSGHEVQTETLDTICIFYLTINDSEISNLASKVLRWRIHAIIKNQELDHFIWSIVYELQESKDNFKVNNSFVFWLRYLNNSSVETLKMNEKLQTLMQSEKYWFYLQSGLTSDSHEHRKYAISLLQLSIKSISSDVDNRLMKWNLQQTDQYLAGWKRYITLFEIIGIDTSLNQAQEASGEMIGLLSLTSKVPVPFTLSLLSIGFKASQEGVRKFAMKLVFAIPEPNLRLLKEDNYSFLKDHFLKYAMAASNFQVHKDYSKSKKFYTCEFGDQLINFIVGCFRGLSKEEATMLSSALISLLAENIDAFDPSRTYVSLGLLKGLQSVKYEVLGIKDLALLNSVFESHCDGEVLNVTVQTVNIRLLLHIDPQAVGLRGLVASLAKFVQFNPSKGVTNGYTIFDANLDFFLDYLSKNYTSQELTAFVRDNAKGLDIDELTIALALTLSKHTVGEFSGLVLSHPLANELLANISTSNIAAFEDLANDPLIRSRCERLVTDLATSSGTQYLYSKSASLADFGSVFNDMFWENIGVNALWTSLVSDLSSGDEEILRLGICKVEFLSNISSKIIYNSSAEQILTFENLSQLQSSAFQNQPKGPSKDFYKSKDSYFAHFYRLVRSMTKVVDVKVNKARFLELIDKDYEKSGPMSQLEIIKLLIVIFSEAEIDAHDSEVVTGFLEFIWSDIDEHRLILSQKELHVMFIKLLFHHKNLSNSIVNDKVHRSIETIGLEIIEKSFMRKSLLPTLVRCISEYQLHHGAEFSKTCWLMHILVQAFFLLQSNNKLFLVEYAVGDIFDASLSLYYGEKIYNKIHGVEELSARVQVMAILGALDKDSKHGEVLWTYILTNDAQLRLFKPAHRSDSNEEWRRIQLLSMLLITAKVVPSDFLFEKLYHQLLDLIFKEPSPLCRVYVEWITAYALLKISPDQRRKIFEKFETSILKQQQTIITSFERINYLLAQQLTQEEESEFLSHFIVQTLLPSCTSNRSLVRHFSVSLVVSIYPEIEKRGLKLDKSLVDAMANIHNNALKTENYQAYRCGDALLWDVDSDFTLVGICGAVLLRISDREIDAIDETRFYQFTSESQRSALKLAVGKDETNLFLPQEKRITTPVMDSFLVNLPPDDADAPSAESVALQTKSGAWATVMNVDETNQVKRSPLVVIASLVEKTVNLGAICRLCDCLGVGTMTLDDINVVKNPQFKNVAVTADHWMPMVEVKMDDIASYMKHQKEQGYTLIGLEQTDRSVELNSSLKFPEKSLILLGKEREGIPGDLLAELDLCIEIKQSGVIRSMNIQTAAAVICHSYSIQHNI